MEQSTLKKMVKNKKAKVFVSSKSSTTQVVSTNNNLYAQVFGKSKNG